MSKNPPHEKSHRVALEPVPGKSPIFFELPFDAREAFGTLRAAVIVRVGAYSFPTTLASMGGRTVVGLNKQHREGAGVEAGQTVVVQVTLDDAPRTVTVPEDFAKALKRSKGALAAWRTLSASHQKEHVRAIEEAKKPETRIRRIAKSIDMLTLVAAGSR